MPKIFMTHNGTMHTDEVCAYAITKKMFPDIKLIRTRDVKIIQKNYSNENVWIVDVGEKHDEALHNFDHHHMQRPIYSAFGLIVKYLHKNNEDFQNLFFNGEAFRKFDEMFVVPIDMYDNNHDNIIYKLSQESALLLQHLVQGFNHDISDDLIQFDQFKKAAEIMTIAINNAILASNNYAKAQQQFSEAEKKGKVVYGETYIPFWKEFAKTTSIAFGIFPSHVEGEWTVQSINSQKYPLPETGDPSCKFLHNNKFIAVFTNELGAKNYAENLIGESES